MESDSQPEQNNIHWDELLIFQMKQKDSNDGAYDLQSFALKSFNKAVSDNRLTTS